MNAKPLKMLRACGDAIRWVENLPSYATPQEAWELCDRPEWMFWLLGKTSADQVLIVRAICKIARIALPSAKGRAALSSIVAAEKWANGKISKDDVYAKRIASQDRTYVWDHYSGDEAAKAVLAINAANCANDAATTHSADEAARRYGDNVVHYVIQSGLGLSLSKRCADIIREFFPNSPL